MVAVAVVAQVLLLKSLLRALTIYRLVPYFFFFQYEPTYHHDADPDPDLFNIFLKKLSISFYDYQVYAYSVTSGFWPRVRALCAARTRLINMPNWALRTPRAPPIAASIFRCFIFIGQKKNLQFLETKASFKPSVLSCTLRSYAASF